MLSTVLMNSFAVAISHQLRHTDLTMKKQTEITIRSILATDNTILSELSEWAITILSGKDNLSEQHNLPLGILRFPTAAKLLNVSTWTVHSYARHGHLDLVYGCGEHNALGVSISSFNRFIRNRTEDHSARIAQRKHAAEIAATERARRIVADRERAIRRIRKLVGEAHAETKFQICKAIEKILESTTAYSTRFVCSAVGIPPSTFTTYRTRQHEPWAAQHKKESVALEIIKANYPDATVRINLSEAHGLVKDHGISITMETVAKLLDANGFDRKRKGSNH